MKTLKWDRSFVVTLFIGLSLSVTFTSCHRTKYAEAISQIDSLFVISDSTAQLLDKVDTVLVLQSRQQFAQNWKLIRTSIESINDAALIKQDTFWNYITIYEAKDRNLKKLMRRFQHLQSAHRENQHQLETLRESLLNNQIPEDSVTYYLHSETVAVSDVQRETSMYIPELNKKLFVLDSLHTYAPAAIGHFQKLSFKSKIK